MTKFAFDIEHSITIPAQNANLAGILYIPTNASGIVLFVHGSGSSRLSVRNQHVAKILNQAGFATLLFDLLTEEEERIDTETGELRFDIEFLADRLIATTNWITKELAELNPNIGYFGASTGGGAALVASANLGGLVKAVVSRGGRPDLAGSALSLVKAPSLLIVGGDDFPVIEMNKEAMSKMNYITELKIITGATHLFEEPGTLDEVAILAENWFLKYLINS